MKPNRKPAPQLKGLEAGRAQHWHKGRGEATLTFVVVLAVEGQGVPLRTLFTFLFRQVCVRVVVTESRAVLVAFPTD